MECFFISHTTGKSEIYIDCVKTFEYFGPYIIIYYKLMCLFPRFSRAAYKKTVEKIVFLPNFRLVSNYAHRECVENHCGEMGNRQTFKNM